jgi:hypothetical protein
MTSAGKPKPFGWGRLADSYGSSATDSATKSPIVRRISGKAMSINSPAVVTAMVSRARPPVGDSDERPVFMWFL